MPKSRYKVEFDESKVDKSGKYWDVTISYVIPYDDYDEDPFFDSLSKSLEKKWSYSETGLKNNERRHGYLGLTTRQVSKMKQLAKNYLPKAKVTKLHHYRD